MIITRENVDKYPELPAEVIRDIKQNGSIYDTEGGADNDGAWITDGGVVGVNKNEENLLVFPARIYNFYWERIPTLADSDKEIYPVPDGAGGNNSSLFNPNKKFKVNPPQKPVVISSNNNKLKNSSDKSELAKNKNAMFFNGIVIEQLETFKKKYFITKEATNLIQHKLTESINSLFNEKNNIDDNKINSVEFIEFSDFSDGSFSEFNIMSTLMAENLINDPDLINKLNQTAKNNSVVNTNARMAVIKKNNDKAVATLVRTDGVLVAKEVPVYEVKYMRNGYYVEIKNLGIEYLITPRNSFGQLGLQGNVSQHHLNENKKFAYPEKVMLSDKIENKKIQVPYPHQFNDAVIVFPKNSKLPPLYVYSGFPAIKLKDKDPRPQQEKEFNEIKDGVQFTTAFYKEVFKAYGDKAEQLARDLASQAKGKTIRNVDDALKAYNKYKANINKKINAKDRQAISAALESVKVADIANNFKRFSKGMLYTSRAIDFVDWFSELVKAIETDNWRPFFVKTEKIAAGMAATAVAGFAFSVLLGGPVGVLGYALIIAGVGALIDDELVEEANKLIGI